MESSENSLILSKTISQVNSLYPAKIIHTVSLFFDLFSNLYLRVNAVKFLIFKSVFLARFTNLILKSSSKILNDPLH